VAWLLGLGDLLNLRADELSSGEMRRVLVARALVHDPETLVLDEPFASLDIAARGTFDACMRGLAARGHGIVLVTHEVSEIPPEIGRVILVKGGRIFADGPKDEVLTTSLISDLFGISIEVEESAGRYRWITA
jgi:iron complex transport system ATP-binding protein